MDPRPTEPVDFRCPRCAETFPTEAATDEHIFPFAIGGPDELLLRACKPCNDKMGQHIEAPLIGHKLMQIKRHDHGVKGRSGEVPNPYEGFRLPTGQPVRVDFSKGIDDPKRFYVSTQKRETEKKTDGSYQIQLTIDAADKARLPVLLAKIKERAARDGKRVEIGEPIYGRTENPQVISTWAFDLTRWIPGMIKIAYELGLHVLGPDYLDDTSAIRIRNYLQGDPPTTERLAAASIQGRVQGVMEKLVPWTGVPENLHIGIVSPNGPGGNIVATIRLFETFAADIVLSNEPDRYSIGPEGVVFVVDARRRSCLRGTLNTLWRLVAELAKSSSDDVRASGRSG